MRKTVVILTIMLIYVIYSYPIAECENNQTYQPDCFTQDDLSVINKSNNIILKYGMEREEAEELLGNAKEDFLGCNIYDDLIIGYRNNKIVGLTIVFTSGKIANFITPRGISGSCKLNDVIANYGKGLVRDNTITYWLEEREQGLISVPHEQIKDQRKAYVLYFTFDNHDSLSRVYIMDYHFGKYMK